MPDYVSTSPELIPIQGHQEPRFNDVEADQDGIWAVTSRFGLVYKTESKEVVFKHEKIKR